MKHTVSAMLVLAACGAAAAQDPPVRYGDVEQLPARLRDYPRIDKPADPRVLASTILSVLGYAWGS